MCRNLQYIESYKFALNSFASVIAVPVMPAKFFIHAEKVLQGDCRIGLCFPLDRDPFLGFNCLMQSIRESPVQAVDVRYFRR